MAGRLRLEGRRSALRRDPGMKFLSNIQSYRDEEKKEREKKSSLSKLSRQYINSNWGWGGRRGWMEGGWVVGREREVSE